MVLLLCGVKSLHLFSQDLVHVRNIDTLVGQFSSEGRELVAKDSYLTFEVIALLLKLGEALTDFGELALLTGDV